MENVKILIDGIQKDVYGLFYVYDSKYYFIYTEKEIVENDYVALYMTQVGKETKNTESGPIDTGYMVGIEITNPEEQQKAQKAISYIVDDKKNNTINPEIQYLPMNMLTNLKIISKKRFRLLKSIITDNFGVQIDGVEPLANIEVGQQTTLDNIDQSQETPIPLAEVNKINVGTVEPVASEITGVLEGQSQLQPLSQVKEQITDTNNNDSNIIVDYRTKYFEEEEKNKELQLQIDDLTKKLNEIKKIIE